MQPIGRIHSCFKEKFGTPRQPGLLPQAPSELHLFEHVQPELSLQGLAGFSHLWVVFEFHQNGHENFRAKISPPRLKDQKVGVFASRSPHRPNPIGLSVVELVKIQGSVLHLRGGDFVDGTPVLDIKPYIAEFDSRPLASKGWLEGVEFPRLQVEWSKEAELQVREAAEDLSLPELKTFLIEVVANDPRPKVYKAKDEQGESQDYACRLFDRDLKFQMLSPQVARIESFVSSSL